MGGQSGSNQCCLTMTSAPIMVIGITLPESATTQEKTANSTLSSKVLIMTLMVISSRFGYQSYPNYWNKPVLQKDLFTAHGKLSFLISIRPISNWELHTQNQ